MASVPLNEIRSALLSVLEKVIKALPDQKFYTLLRTNEETTIPKGNTTVLQVFAPGHVAEGELGGPNALSLRDGVYTVTLGVPRGKPVPPAIDLTDKIAHAYRRQRLGTKNGCTLWCDEPYTTNAGVSPTGDHYLITVTIPWTATVGGQEERLWQENGVQALEKPTFSESLQCLKIL